MEHWDCENYIGFKILSLGIDFVLVPNGQALEAPSEAFPILPPRGIGNMFNKNLLS